MKKVIFIMAVLQLLLTGRVISQIKEFAHYPCTFQEIVGKAGANSPEIEKSFQIKGKREKQAMAFLLAYMPENDLKTLTSEFIMDQVTGAMKARREFKWCRNLPDSIFLNEVLPYCSLDEKRDNWRWDFYHKFSPLVKKCKTVYEAIDSVNLNIRKILQVEYNTKRSIVNISPFKAMGEKMATCTGLSFLLIDAFRSVGIPARMAGTPMWTNMRGNHNWVEVWIDGKWFFTEYYPDKLNKSWFLTDAGKADMQKPEHWIYAASYKPGDTFFMRVWDENARDINAWNVTSRYIELYRNSQDSEELKPGELWLKIVFCNSPECSGAESRISRKITVIQDNKQVDFGYSPMPTDDLNRFLKFRVKKSTAYRIEYRNSENIPIQKEITTGTKDEMMLTLF